MYTKHLILHFYIYDTPYFKDLKKFHPNDFQCDRHDDKDEGCGLTEQSWEDNKDCTHLEGTIKICCKVTPLL